MITARTAGGARIFFSSKVKACSACSRQNLLVPSLSVLFLLVLRLLVQPYLMLYSIYQYFLSTGVLTPRPST